MSSNRSSGESTYVNPLSNEAPKYWYPNKSPDLKEVRAGYNRYQNISINFVWLVLPPIAVVYGLLYWTSSSTVAELYIKMHLAITVMLEEHPNNAYMILFVLVSSFLMALLIASMYHFYIIKYPSTTSS